jgi:hypothetical protein
MYNIPQNNFRCEPMNHLLASGFAIVCLSLPGIAATAIPVQAAPQSAKKPAVKPKPAAAAKQTNISATTIQEAGIRYSLSFCRRVETSVVCRLSLLNKNDKDVAVSLQVNGTRFIDKDGEEYLSKEVQIGSVKSESEAENMLISDISTKATVTFDAPPANVATMTVLAINHSPGSILKFRNVKIIK